MWSREGESVYIRRNLLEAPFSWYTPPPPRVLSSKAPPQGEPSAGGSAPQGRLASTGRQEAVHFPRPGPASVSLAKNTYPRARGRQCPFPASQLCLRSSTTVGSAALVRTEDNRQSRPLHGFTVSAFRQQRLQLCQVLARECGSLPPPSDLTSEVSGSVSCATTPASPRLRHSTPISGQRGLCCSREVRGQ